MKAVQSAMAIRRQRRRRDDAVRAKARRSSHQSDHYMLSESREGSQMSLDGVGRHGTSRRQMMGGVTTFHVGIVFFIMGLMLVISGLVPGYTNRQRQYWEENKPGSSFWSDREGYGNAALLLATGSFLIMVGVALVVANRIASKKEDEQFTRYISRKLAPARLSHHPVSSLHAVSKQQQHQEAVAVEDDEESPGQQSQQQQQQQLESITEEAEGSSASKDQLFWTSDVAPVHKQSNHHHHHHGSSTG